MTEFMSASVAFCDGSVQRRVAQRKADPLFEGVVEKIVPLVTSPPEISDNIHIMLHEMQCLRIQADTALHMLPDTTERAAYLYHLRARANAISSCVPPWRPLPFRDENNNCFFACSKSDNGCFINPVLQLLASMEALGAPPEVMWDDIRKDPSDAVHPLIRLVAEQIHDLNYPQKNQDMVTERARLREIHSHFTEAKKKKKSELETGADLINMLLELLTMIRPHIYDALMFKYVTMTTTKKTSSQMLGMLHVDLATKVRCLPTHARCLKTDLEEALKKRLVVSDKGFQYTTTSGEGAIGDRRCIVIRVANATTSSSFPFELPPTTRIATIGNSGSCDRVHLSPRGNSYFLRSVGLANAKGEMDTVYVRKDAKWWRMTGVVEDVTDQLFLQRGMKPDRQHIVSVLVYEYLYTLKQPWAPLSMS
jgi:hypothetical protein